MGDEYVWKAAWSFHTEGDQAAETWVRHYAAKILAGKAHCLEPGLMETIKPGGTTNDVSTEEVP